MTRNMLLAAALAVFGMSDAAIAHERKAVRVDEMTVSSGDTRAGGPIVLEYGGGLNSPMWSGYVEAAAPTHRLLTPDTRHHGGTDNPSGTFGYDLAAQDLTGFIAALGLERPVVTGFSDGGIIVQKLLIAHRRGASSAIIGSATNRVAADDHFMAGMMAFYGNDKRGQSPDAVPEALEVNAPDFAGRPRELYGGDATPEGCRDLHKPAWPVWTTEMKTPADQLATIGVPVLGILGQNDDFFRPKDGLALA